MAEFWIYELYELASMLFSAPGKSTGGRGKPSSLDEDIVQFRINGHLWGNVWVVQESKITIRKHKTILINKKYIC